MRVVVFSLWLMLGILGCSEPSKPLTPLEFIQAEPKYQLNAKLVKQAKEYCEAHKLNSHFFLLADMSIRSGKKRFFMVSIDSNKITKSGLVAHGHCQNYASIKPNFSNVSGSNCSSLGKYKIGGKYDGSFGTAYKLHGLESSNSNAFDRFVVLHAHPCVPDENQQFPICRSEGCPTLSPAMLQALEPALDDASRPVLLWIIGDLNE